MAKMSLNTLKLLVMGFSKDQLVPELMLIDYFKAKSIKSRFAVMANGSKDFLVFNNLQSAFKYAENFIEDNHFFGKEFFNNFRILEVDDSDKNCLTIRAIIVNAIDFFDILVNIKDKKVDIANCKDIDFNEYYSTYSEVL